MSTYAEVVLTEAQPVLATENLNDKFFDGVKVVQINVESLDSNGDVIANTGTLSGRWKGVNSGVWDDFKDTYALDGSLGGGWLAQDLSAQYLEFDGTGVIPAGGSIRITVRN